MSLYLSGVRDTEWGYKSGTFATSLEIFPVMYWDRAWPGELLVLESERKKTAGVSVKSWGWNPLRF